MMLNGAGGQRVSATTRLRILPDVFTITSASAMLDMSTEAVSIYLSRWKQRGLVRGFGRTGVYFNMLTGAEPAEETVREALNLALRRPMIEAGGSVMAKIGLTMQRHVPMEVLVPVVRLQYQTVPDIPGIHLLRRPQWWFDYMLTRSRARDMQPGGIPSASASLALADALLASCSDEDFGFRVRPVPDPAWLPDAREIAETSYARQDLARKTLGHMAQILRSSPASGQDGMSRCALNEKSFEIMRDRLGDFAAIIEGEDVIDKASESDADMMAPG